MINSAYLRDYLIQIELILLNAYFVFLPEYLSQPRSFQLVLLNTYVPEQTLYTAALLEYIRNVTPGAFSAFTDPSLTERAEDAGT